MPFLLFFLFFFFLQDLSAFGAKGTITLLQLGSDADPPQFYSALLHPSLLAPSGAPGEPVPALPGLLHPGLHSKATQSLPGGKGEHGQNRQRDF